MNNNQCKIKVKTPKHRNLSNESDEAFVIDKNAWYSFYSTGNYVMVDENGGTSNVDTDYTIENWPS